MIMNTAAESRKQHAERKQQIIDLLDKGIAFFKKINKENEVAALESHRESVKNGEYSIVVVGEFSSGKSTLLNALMQKKLLTSFSDETTATVNFLRHKDCSENGIAGKVYYKNGDVKNLDVVDESIIKQFVTTKGDNVVSSIEKVDIYFESDFLKDNVVLVDSPGINGIAQGHREITEQQILKSHACVFVFSADHPGTLTDFEFIQDLRKKVKTIIFVLNKIDRIDENEGETPKSVIESLKNNYKKFFPEVNAVPEIWPVSAKEALEGRLNKDSTKINQSQLPAFEDRLFRFLTQGEKSVDQLVSPIEKFESLLIATKDQIEIDLKSLEGTVDSTDLDNQIEELRNAKENLDKKLTDQKKQVLNKVSTAMEDVSNDLLANLKRIKDSKISAVDLCEDLGELKELVKNFESSYISRVNSLALDAEAEFDQNINDIIQIEYASEYDSIKAALGKQTESLDLSGISAVDEQTLNKFDIKVGLEQMEKQQNDLNEKLKEQEKEVEKCSNNVLAARRKQREIDDLKDQINRIRSEKNTLEMMREPPVYRYQKEVDKEVPIRGIWGVVKYAFKGHDHEKEYEQAVDSSDRDKFNARRDSQLREKDDAIGNLEKDLDSKKDFESTDEAELQKSQAIRKLQEIETQVTELKKQNEQEINAKYAAVIAACKNEMLDYSDTLYSEIRSSIRQWNRRMKDRYVGVVTTVMSAKIATQINEKCEHIEKLKKQMSQSTQERNAKIDEGKSLIQEIDSLLTESVNLGTELDSIERDEIKETAI